jgi:pre-mRNA-splicing factor CWC22
MGLKSLAERFKNPEVKRGCEGMFLMYVPKNTRFAINYFTSIGLGMITEEMREYLKMDSFILSSFEILITIIII